MKKYFHNIACKAKYSRFIQNDLQHEKRYAKTFKLTKWQDRISQGCGYFVFYMTRHYFAFGFMHIFIFNISIINYG